jgi:phosphoglycolate phosphatase-like HAD superfamily hydrolase
VRSTKPAPDVVQAALVLLELSPSEAAMLGDTPYDRDAANGAGVDFVGLRCGGWSDQDLVDAIVIYDDPSNLLEHFDSSPFAALA